jgi:hypothetical protein
VLRPLHRKLLCLPSLPSLLSNPCTLPLCALLTLLPAAAAAAAGRKDVLELLIEVAESYPKFLRKHLQELVSAMMQVRRMHSVQQQRAPAAPAAPAAAGLLRQLQQHLQQLLGAMMQVQQQRQRQRHSSAPAGLRSLV